MIANQNESFICYHVDDGAAIDDNNVIQIAQEDPRGSLAHQTLPHPLSQASQ